MRTGDVDMTDQRLDVMVPAPLDPARSLSGRPLAVYAEVDVKLRVARIFEALDDLRLDDAAEAELPHGRRVRGRVLAPLDPAGDDAVLE